MNTFYLCNENLIKKYYKASPIVISKNKEYFFFWKNNWCHYNLNAAKEQISWSNLILKYE